MAPAAFEAGEQPLGEEGQPPRLAGAGGPEGDGRGLVPSDEQPTFDGMAAEELAIDPADAREASAV